MSSINNETERTRKIRITRNYVMHWDLQAETGIERIDDYLYCLLNILQITLKEDLRAAYLIGSYVYGCHAPDSDLDLCLIFRDGSDRFREAWSIVEHIGLLTGQMVDPMYRGFEAPLYDTADTRDDCNPILRMVLKDHSLFLLGDDVRPKIALNSEDELLEYIITTTLNAIRSAHGMPTDGRAPFDDPITYPLFDPAIDQEDRGFGDFMVVWKRSLCIARAIIFLESREFVFNKTLVADALANHVDRRWSDLFAGISNARYGKIPEPDKHAAWLHTCRCMTAFENHFLERLSAKGMAHSCDIVGLS